MPDLITFLRVRLDEDEAAVRNANDPARSIAEAMWQVGQGYTVEDIRLVGEDGSVDWSPLNPDDVKDEALHMGHALRVLEHMKRAGWMDPARVLAEVEAKRAVLDLWEWSEGRWTGDWDQGDQTLRILAKPYACHPDYDPSWGPAGSNSGGDR